MPWPARFLSLLVSLGVALAASAASFPPRLRFRTLETPEVRVHYHVELEATARQAAALANEILPRLEARYGVAVPRVEIVIADTSDDPNGFASPLPYPLVHIRAVGPDGSDEFGNHDGWLRLVLTHELTHIVHLEPARGVLGVGRRVFGRAPYLFPNGLTPPWLLEGLATYEETEGTAFGRGRNPDVAMVRRAAARAGRFPREDQATLGLDAWPGGISAYLFGEAFLRDLEASFGEGTLPRLARVHAGRVLPYADDWTAQTVTGASFHTRWREWSVAEARRAASLEAEITGRGLTASRSLTTRGVRQTRPRFSPDGARLAYTSGSLERFRAIRVMAADGTGDRELARRNGGSGLAWTPDGRALVFDESEIQHLFATHSDLRVVELATGRVRPLTRGLRAREPDVAPDGRRVVFVRELGGHAELATIGLDGAGFRLLTASAPETEWSGPRFAPDGRAIVASRWSRGGFLDVVLVDAESGAVTPLLEDRAKDVEPDFTPDGRFVVFRSDRDGVSNLYALRLADGTPLRVTNVPGGAFTPDVAPDGRRLAFASYTAAGYDLQLMEVLWDELGPVPFFVDRYPASAPEPLPWSGRDEPYRPFSSLRPRFWSPYLSFGDEARLGAVSGSIDPLFRHAYGLDVFRGFETGRFGVRGVYQYDRFLPTLLAAFEDVTDPLADGGLFRSQEATLRLSLPLWRRLRHAQAFAVTYRRRIDRISESPLARRDDRGAVEAAWSLSSAKSYPFSISPVEGWRVRMGFAREAKALGSELSLSKLSGDARFYTRGLGRSDAVAVRAGGGLTLGEPRVRSAYSVGGFPDGSLLDVLRTNAGILRGYPDDAFSGRSYAHANLEYRFPLARVQRGWRTFPVFVRHLHGALFADAASAWSGSFRLADVKTAAGLSLGADFFVGHRLPVTVTSGVARGFASGGETRAYWRAGLSF